jgi:hypothetical protein
MPDNPRQNLQVACMPGLIIALRSGKMPGFSQCGQLNMLETLRTHCFGYYHQNVILIHDGCLKHTTGTNADKYG